MRAHVVDLLPAPFCTHPLPARMAGDIPSPLTCEDIVAFVAALLHVVFLFFFWTCSGVFPVRSLHRMGILFPPLCCINSGTNSEFWNILFSGGRHLACMWLDRTRLVLFCHPLSMLFEIPYLLPTYQPTLDGTILPTSSFCLPTYVCLHLPRTHT